MNLLPFLPLVALSLAGCSVNDVKVRQGDAGAASTLPGAGGAGGSSSVNSSTGTGQTVLGGNPSTGGNTTNLASGTASTGGAVGSSGGASVSSSAPSQPGGGGSSSGGNGATVGGNTAKGGSFSKGGSTATGGNGQTGGSNGTGGATGGAASGGQSAKGGTFAKGGASATGGANSGTGGATTGYQPCPTDGTACKILPLGDSITFGVGDEPNGGYRGPLFALAVAAGQKITFTGSVSNGPSTISGQTFPKKNEGHSGWGISTVTTYSGGNAGIATLIPTPAFASGNGGVPHIILLMIGTNDSTEATAAEMTSRLSGLMDKLITNAPDALLVVGKITPLSWASTIAAYNTSITGLVQTRATAGKHVTIVDMNTGFNTSTMFSSDNIHPNATGYKFMADRWYAAISAQLPK